MLLQFNFKNFKSFRDEAALDMTAANVSEFPDHVVSMGGERVLPVAAIYGPNASGKSNVCEAFEYMRHMVLMSFRLSGTDSRSALCLSYSLGGHHRRESSFEVFFADPCDPKERIFNYGFCIDRERRIAEEWLNVKAKTSKESKRVFHRDEQEGTVLDLSGVDRAFRRNIEVSLDKDALLLSLGNSLQVPELKKVYNWFVRCSSISFGRSGRYSRRAFERWFRRNQDKESDVLKYLATFDDSISSIEVVEYEEPGHSEEVPERTVSEIIAFHKAGGGLSLSFESDGTLQMLDLYPTLASAFEHGGVVMADELGAHLHPLLLRNVVLSFLNPEVNKGHAQLVFTTHDVWLLFAGLLRRDEVWFTEKDSDGVSSLYSLADFEDEDGKKIRKDESFGKNYLLGKYGAIPSLSQIGCLS